MLKIIRKIYKGACTPILSVPKEVMNTLEVKTGDSVVFVIDGDNVRIKKVEL